MIDSDDRNMTDAYLKYGRGKVNGVKKDNVISYKVIYNSVYSKNTPPWTNGKNISYFTLIKETDNGPWLIDDMGE